MQTNACSVKNFLIIRNLVDGSELKGQKSYIHCENSYTGRIICLINKNKLEKEMIAYDNLNYECTVVVLEKVI